MSRENESWRLLHLGLYGWIRFLPLGQDALPAWSAVFATAGAVAMAVSALHLGRPARAWRGLFNWRRSWISREAVLVTVFLAGATVDVIEQEARQAPGGESPVIERGKDCQGSVHR